MFPGGRVNGQITQKQDIKNNFCGETELAQKLPFSLKTDRLLKLAFVGAICQKFVLVYNTVTSLLHFFKKNFFYIKI